MDTKPVTTWKYLAPKPNSVLRQLFIAGRRISARTLYGSYCNEEEPMCVEEIAANYRLPEEAVREAIAYCESNPPELLRDYALSEALYDARGGNDPGFDGRLKTISPEVKNAIMRNFG